MSSYALYNRRTSKNLRFCRILASIPSGRNSVVECLLPKQKVVSSNLIARSTQINVVPEVTRYR